MGYDIGPSVCRECGEPIPRLDELCEDCYNPDNIKRVF